MKLVIFLAAVSIAFANPTLLGTEKCTYGPAYWCKSLKTSQECTAIKHCLVNDWKRMKVNVHTNSQCELCQHAVLEGRELLKNGASKDEMTGYIENFCSKVDDSIKQECLAVTSGSMDEIIQMLESELSPDIMCHILEMCDASDDEGKPVSNKLIHVPLHRELYKPLLSLVPAKSIDPVVVDPVTDVSVGNQSTWCGDCTRFFTDIKNMMVSNKTEGDIEQMLDDFVCQGLGPISGTCKKLVHEFTPLIMNYFVSEFDPKTECQVLGFCTAGKMPAEFMKPMVSKNSSVCDDCKKFVADIAEMIKSKQTQDQIENLLNQMVCSSLGPLADSCKEIVKDYVPMVLSMLAGYVVPTQDCQALGFCAGSNPIKLRLQLSQLSQLSHLIIQKPNPATCDICNVMITELKSMMEEPKTQQEVMTFVENEICGLFKSEKQACITLVKQYGVLFIEAIVTELDATTICKALGLCPANVAKTEPIPENTSSNENDVHKLSASTQCILCEFMIRELQTLLKDNSTEEEIIAALDEVCNLLPGTLKDQCVAFIAQYGPAILDLLMQELDPKSICTMIGVCQAEERFHKHLVAGHGSAFSSEQCTVCQTIVQYVYSMLKENSTEQEIEEILEKVCNFLPTSMREQCDAIVEKYTETIIVLITQMATPLEICQGIGMCDKPKVDTALYFQPRLRIVHNNEENNRIDFN